MTRLIKLARADRIALGLLLPLALLAGIIALWAVPPEKRGGVFEQPSTFFNVEYGTGAAYETLGRLGYDVWRLRRPLEEAPLDRAGTLFVLQPIVAVNDEEHSLLLRWVERGGTLVVSPGVAERFDRYARWEDPVEDRPRTPIEYRRGSELIEHPLLTHVDALTARPGRALRPDSPFSVPPDMEPRVFWEGSRGPLGAAIGHGRGTIVVLGDLHPLSNAGLDEADNAMLLVNLAQAGVSSGRGRGVWFDEYHLGFEQRDVSPVAMAKLAFDSRWRPAVLQAGAVLLLALLARAVRFGPVAPQPVRRRRRQGEFADAAAQLLYEGRAYGVVTEKLVRHYTGRLRELTGLPPGTNPAELTRAVHNAAGPEAGRALEDTLARRPSTPREVVSVAKQLDELVKALEA